MTTIDSKRYKEAEHQSLDSVAAGWEKCFVKPKQRTLVLKLATY